MSLGRSGSEAARYGVPGLVLGMALMWITGGGRAPVAQAQTGPRPDRLTVPSRPERPGPNPPPASDPTGTIAFTTTYGGGMAQLLYLIDTKARTFALYQIDPTNAGGKGSVKLEAVRHYSFDLKLTGYNNQPPEVKDVESIVKTLGPANP
jgi:hypothetical protein